MIENMMPRSLNRRRAAPVVLNRYAEGGPVMGPGDGTSDSIPAMVDGVEPAALSQGEYVIPADVVSGLGNGSTEAGVARLEQLVAQIRATKTGNTGLPPRV